MKNTLCVHPLRKPTLQPLPLTLSTNMNTDNVFSCDTFAVAVNYYVLRPKKKNNS